MYNFYTEPKHKSQTIDNFLEKDKIREIVDSYYTATDIFSEFYKTKYHITEINIKPIEGEIKTIRMVNPSRGREIVLDYEKNIKPLNKIKKEKIFSWTKTICSHLENSFEKQNFPAKIKTINIHNLNDWIEIHCDGVNIQNRKEPRPGSFPYYDPKNYYPESFIDYAHQGLITLKNNGENNGTIIFDQWFPISTYVEQDNDFNANKANIRFFRGEPLERFGETIRFYTNTDMPDEDYNKIINAIGNDRAFSREKAFGFTLDKILFFDKPGTLNVWATKKYHLPIPLPKKQWSADRIMLQYETVYA